MNFITSTLLIVYLIINIHWWSLFIFVALLFIMPLQIDFFWLVLFLAYNLFAPIWMLPS